jgi:hypothetical protein
LNIQEHFDAVAIVANELKKYEIDVLSTEERSMNIDIIAPLTEKKTIRIIVRKISDNNSTYISQTQMDIKDEDLYVAVLHIKSLHVRDIYLFPAAAWQDTTSYFMYYPHNNPKHKSKPEYGICFSQKALDALYSYKLQRVFEKMGLTKTNKR